MRITSKFGYRIHPIDHVRRMHSGLDIVSDVGGKFPIYAVGGGRVVRSRQVARTGCKDNTWQWGQYVAVQQYDGKTVYYCHLSKRNVKAGEVISAGQQIGISGSTGYSTGIHLHFEVRNAKGVAINAADYLGIPNQVGSVKIPQLEPRESTDSTPESVEKYTIPNGAKYTNGMNVPKRLWGKTFTVCGRTARAVLLEEINSWVVVK